MRSKAKSKKDRAATKAEKPRILRWRGVLADAKPSQRIVILIVLAVACVTLTFTQLGFFGVGLPGEYVAYAVLLLQPIAVTALLYGAGWGTLMGLLAGGSLWFHSIHMPLDYYELTFVTPFTSVMLLASVGFLLGIFFALALRKDPPLHKRIVRVVLICCLVSWLYTLLFCFMNGVTMVIRLSVDPRVSEIINDEEQLDRLIDNALTVFIVRYGKIGVQAWFDAALMAVLCLLVDRGAHHVIQRKNDVVLHELFNAWLTVVVLLAFMVTSALSFVSITLGERARAKENMVAETEYLCNLIKYSSDKSLAVTNFIDTTTLEGVDQGAIDSLIKSTSVEDTTILDGYIEAEDGIFLITREDDGCIVQSNSSKFEEGEYVKDCLGEDIVSAMEESIKTQEPQRVVFDDMDLANQGSIEEAMVFIPSQLALLQSSTMRGYMVTMIMPASLVYAERIGVMAWASLTTLIVLLSVYGQVARLLDVVVVKRINETNGILGRITAGDLDARVEVNDTREFSSLSTGINTTVDALKGWINEAETRMDAELATAGAIQEAALPRVFPPFPDIRHFDIYASMNPAKEVGGDFYDFFLVGEDSGPDSGKLAFLVADVSGKGVPAALFMMAAKALMHDYMASGMELGEAFENVNRQLCDGNDADMFVTAFAGILDYATGHVEYVNAGHNPPLLWQNGTWNWLRKKSGLPLGIFDGLPYRAHTVDCALGDQFLIYTDGVTEAMSTDENQYGEERLEELVHNNYDLHPRMLIEEVRRDVARHASGAEQSDDITILALEVGVPPEITATLAVPAVLKNLTQVNEFIHTELDRRLCPMRTQIQLDVAVEEMFVNVCNYAYPAATEDQPGMVNVSYSYSAEPPSVRIDLVDQGIPFDPLAKPDAQTPDSIADVPIGGLGILMAKRSVDEMRYKREDGCNIVTLIKTW